MRRSFENSNLGSKHAPLKTPEVSRKVEPPTVWSILKHPNKPKFPMTKQKNIQQYPTHPPPFQIQREIHLVNPINPTNHFNPHHLATMRPPAPPTSGRSIKESPRDDETNHQNLWFSIRNFLKKCMEIPLKKTYSKWYTVVFHLFWSWMFGQKSLKSKSGFHHDCLRLYYIENLMQLPKNGHILKELPFPKLSFWVSIRFIWFRRHALNLGGFGPLKKRGLRSSLLSPAVCLGFPCWFRCLQGPQRRSFQVGGGGGGRRFIFLSFLGPGLFSGTNCYCSFTGVYVRMCVCIIYK